MGFVPEPPQSVKKKCIRDELREGTSSIPPTPAVKLIAIVLLVVFISPIHAPIEMIALLIFAC